MRSSFHRYLALRLIGRIPGRRRLPSADAKIVTFADIQNQIGCGRIPRIPECVGEGMRQGIIRQTASDELAGMLPLSWSHYAFLFQIENVEERRFCEIEAAQQKWSLREMKRQFNTSLKSTPNLREPPG